ncbi:MAG: AbrB/MazE/SpoVT family DNA-binding domain-containing protein [Candidatus Eremiobacteraeota bacterium]|nr:AbrB/MazE/SpoVT family DNA-binding domain-containing protein [Candidatus Eremiobacteraeota bacterium]MBC5803559.1 AbrB/MazE/SpoVT family DNA-binding domain-containing protein [Candidatus Eremiobacteraeota bacterium]MBC5822386.1 AbrB/MazE/SpoVT family DNA-binding domain-containing protein [Candidatus Eremiobacteraeota bacterium]
MHAIISRWGNSLALRIPKAAVDAANLHEGDSVTISEDGGTLRIARSDRIDVQALISKITPENLNRDEGWITAKRSGVEW